MTSDELNKQWCWLALNGFPKEETQDAVTNLLNPFQKMLAQEHIERIDNSDWASGRTDDFFIYIWPGESGQTPKIWDVRDLHQVYQFLEFINNLYIHLD